MKITLTFSMFVDQFNHTRRGEQFSYSGLKALFGSLEDIDPDYELDVIGLCCDFCEDDIENVRAEYGLDEDEDVVEWLQDNTQVIWYDDETVLYQVF
jgi:hypothetical protein